MVVMMTIKIIYDDIDDEVHILYSIGHESMVKNLKKR